MSFFLPLSATRADACTLPRCPELGPGTACNSSLTVPVLGAGTARVSPGLLQCWVSIVNPIMFHARSSYEASCVF
jgi:hypothetical protein